MTDDDDAPFRLAVIDGRYNQSKRLVVASVCQADHS